MSSGKPISRNTAPRFASTFATAENSAQTAYAYQRQENNFRFPAQRTSSSAQPSPQQQKTSQSASSKQLQSSFGRATAPGTNTMDRPRVSKAPTVRPQLSLSQMSNFIRSQPGGRSFMDESDHRNGGPVNFDQTLSFAGQSMAKKGQLPPELAQMAIPFKPNPQARAIAQKKEESWQQMTNESTIKKQPRAQSWQQSQQARTIESLVQQEKLDSYQRAAQQASQKQADQIRSMGIPFKRSQQPNTQTLAPQQQRQTPRQKPMEQYTEEQTESAPLQPRATNAPPAVHLVRQQHPLALPTKPQQTMQQTQQQQPAYQVLLDSMVQTKQAQTAFASDAAQVTGQEQSEPEASTMFSEYAQEISAAVERSGQTKDATFHQLPVTKLKAGLKT